jgi:hypothetical protein
MDKKLYNWIIFATAVLLMALTRHRAGLERERSERAGITRSYDRAPATLK